MRILVFGTTGQVATELARTAPEFGANLVVLGRDEADLSDPAECAAAVFRTGCDLVINAAAYTAVDRAEEERDMAFAVNGEAPGAMARAAASKGLPFLHISTDYVFDGAPGRAWIEDDPVAPLGAYGASKLEGERAVLEVGGDSTILRTAWVFSAHGANFVKTMLRFGKEHDELRVVDDQTGGPTPARGIARALLTVATARVRGEGETGIFHFAGGPSVSWAGFARAIFAGSGGNTPRVIGIPSSEYPTPAMRPANSVLDCTKINRVYGIAQPDWQAGLAEVLEELP